MQTQPLAKRPPHRTNKRACQFCKVRHLRCDGLEPCVNCEHRGSECIYAPDPLFDNLIAPRSKTTAADANQSTPPRPTKRAKLSASDDVYDSTTPNLTPGAPPHQPAAVAPHQSSLPPIAALPTSVYSNQPQVPLPPMHFNPSPFVPSSVPATQPPVGAPPRLGNSLVLSFARTVQPVASAHFTTKDAASLQRLLQTEKARLAHVETSALVKAFVECAMVAHGSRYSGNPQLAQKYADKAYQIFLLLISTRENVVPDSPQALEFASQVQAIISGMELLTYFLIGSDELIRARQMSTEAHRLLSLYREHVTPATMHRVYTLMVGQANDSDDALYYWDKAQRVLETTPGLELELSAYVIFSLAVTGRHPVRCDMDITISATPGQGRGGRPAPPADVVLVERILNFLNKFEAEVAKFQVSSAPDAAILTRVYMAVITGSRAICLWQLGKKEQAIEYATKLIHMGRASSVIPLTYIQCYAYACKIAQVAGLTDLLKLGLVTLEQDAELYPLTKRMYLEIRRAAKLDAPKPSTASASASSSSFPPPAYVPPSGSAPNGNNSNNNQPNNVSSMDAPGFNTSGPPLPTRFPAGAPMPSHGNNNNNTLVPPSPIAQQQQQQQQLQQQVPPPTGYQPISMDHVDYFGPRPFEQYASGLIQDIMPQMDAQRAAAYGFTDTTPGGAPAGSQNQLAFPFGPGSPVGMTLSELEAGQLFDPAPFWPGSYI